MDLGFDLLLEIQEEQLVLDRLEPEEKKTCLRISVQMSLEATVSTLVLQSAL